jgi:hypothetical protein
MVETVSPKTQLINDINNSWHKLTGKNIDANEFDFLYDQDQECLEYYLKHLNYKLDFLDFIIRVEAMLMKIDEGE